MCFLHDRGKTFNLVCFLKSFAPAFKSFAASAQTLCCQRSSPSLPALKSFAASTQTLRCQQQNFFKALEIYFRTTKIYFQAFEIYFQATKKVFIRAKGKLFPRSMEFVPSMCGSYSLEAWSSYPRCVEVIPSMCGCCSLGELSYSACIQSLLIAACIAVVLGEGCGEVVRA